MSLSIGIVGLPNVGKSTTFNALSKTQNAESANYPFCTIEPNKAIVELKDGRLDKISNIVNPQKIVYANVEFIDIAGLVKGASSGEGLGNKFLSNIKETSVILHIVRCFDDENITHVDGDIDPIRDIETIETELVLADHLSTLKKIEKVKKLSKSDKSADKQLKLLEDIYKYLDSNNMLTKYPKREEEDFIKLDKELQFLSNKEVIYVSNVGENDISSINSYSKKVSDYANKNGASFIMICSKIEEELATVTDEERDELLSEFGATQSGLDKIIELGFSKLGLITYFTAGKQEVRAWTIKNGYKAPQAASVIHNDFEKGFIKAEVISYDDFISSGGENRAKEQGKVRIEGKDYLVKSGDIMHFRFNV